MDGYSSRNSESVKGFIYRFLQRLFFEPDSNFLEFLLKNSRELEEIGIRLDRSLDLETLKTEYTRLFLGPEGHLPPYESVFLEGRFWGNPTDKIKQFLREIGLTLDQDFNMPPDHISLEFEILEKILASNDPNRGELYLKFMEQHIPWIFDFLIRIISRTELQFYRSAFAFTKVFLKEEMQNSLAQSNLK